MIPSYKVPDADCNQNWNFQQQFL